MVIADSSFLMYIDRAGQLDTLKEVSSLSFVRNPTSGELDQQGWQTYKIDIKVSEVSNKKPSADFSYVVNELRVETTMLPSLLLTQKA